MNDRAKYAPGAAAGGEIRKDGDEWTLVLVRDLRHPPAKVWQALTEPAQLREWAPLVSALTRNRAILNVSPTA